MKIHVLPNTIAFEGVLDEGVAIEKLEAPLMKLKKEKNAQAVAVDFSKVSYANSAGIVVWLKAIYGAGVAIKYVNAPVWLVNQFNMIRGYFENGSFVESILAPYYAPKTQDSRNFTLKIGQDVPVLEDYSGFKLSNRVDDGKSYEIDFDPEQFFSFVAENFKTFKEKLK